MKFSYPLIKKFVPRIKSKAQVVHALTMYSCEAESLSGSTIDVSLPPNRYADMASHVGIAREVSAILKIPLKTPKLDFNISKIKKTKGIKELHVVVRDHKACPRYSAQVLEGITVKASPKWIQNVLSDCGIRSINNVVDVMNYVMVELGQPLHAFDADKLSPSGNPTITIRRAKKGEKITSIDDNRYTLDVGTLLIADSSKPLAIAGIKGGKGSEVTEKTKNIIIEAANFDPVGIYRSSRALSLVTDASLRFSHGLHSSLTSVAIERATELLVDIADAKKGEMFDSRTKPFGKHILAVDSEFVSSFIGVPIKPKVVIETLERLGFIVKKQKQLSRFLVEVPLFRTDILTHEDIVEEIVRFIGYQKIRSVAPHISLTPATEDSIITLRERAGQILQGLGIDEIRTHSFVTEDSILVRSKALELENPPSDVFKYLRQSLVPNVINSVAYNKKYFDTVKIFEIGNVFSKKSSTIHTEHVSICASVTGKGNESLFELKGMIEALMRALGISAIALTPCTRDTEIPNTESFLGAGLLQKPSRLSIYVRKTPLGFIGLAPYGDSDRVAVAELNLSLLLAEVTRNRIFTSLSKHPTVVRDISLLVSRSVRIGDVLQDISLINKKLIEDVDLVDEYIDPSWDGKQSLTFRITFQADDRTLTSEEVDKEMKKIERMLEKDYSSKVR